MKLGMVGLGRMGGNMTKRLRRDGHEVTTYDPRSSRRRRARGARAQLDAPRAVWLMIPAGIATGSSATSRRILEAGDTIVDGGNSNFARLARAPPSARARDPLPRRRRSGGVWGLAGHCLMVGGHKEAVARLEPALDELAAPPMDAGGSATPGVRAIRRNRRRARRHCGQPAPATSRRWSTTGSSTG